MDKNELEKYMRTSREVVMLKLRSEILPFYKKIKSLPSEEKKGEDLDEYSFKIIFDLVEEYLDICSIVTPKDSWELIQDVLEYYSNGKLPYGFMAKYDYEDITNALEEGSEFFVQYQEKFNSEGKHDEIKLIQNQEVSIVDRESGNVEFSFYANSGEIIDNTSWKKLPEDTRIFLADYIVSGFLEQELLEHQLELRKIDAEYITLDDFIDKYRKMKKAVELGEIEKKELDEYVAQYVQEGIDDVILLSEENISEILGFCRAEIKQNILEQDGVICDYESADEFIKKLLILHRGKLGNDSESLEKIDKYIEFFNISKGIGLSNAKVITRKYYYGNNIGLGYVFLYMGEWDYKIAIDKWGDTNGCLNEYNLDELRKLDEERDVSNSGNPITIDEYIKKKIIRSVMHFLRQEIIAKQIEIREKYRDTAFLFEEEIVKLIKIWMLSESKRDSEIDGKIEEDMNSLYETEDEMIDSNQSTILLSEENVDELMELINEALISFDFSDVEQCKCVSGRIARFTEKMLSNLVKKIQQEPVTDENARKIERIKAYDEYLMRCQSAFRWDLDCEWYEYRLGKNGGNSLEVVLYTPREFCVYRMSKGQEYLDTCSNIIADECIKEGYLTSLDKSINGDDCVESPEVSEENSDALKGSLRKIYAGSDSERRIKFHQKIEKLIQDLENQR